MRLLQSHTRHPPIHAVKATSDAFTLDKGKKVFQPADLALLHKSSELCNLGRLVQFCVFSLWVVLFLRLRSGMKRVGRLVGSAVSEQFQLTMPNLSRVVMLC